LQQLPPGFLVVLIIDSGAALPPTGSGRIAAISTGGLAMQSLATAAWRSDRVNAARSASLIQIGVAFGGTKIEAAALDAAGQQRACGQ
jgi:hypothetical protein